MAMHNTLIPVDRAGVRTKNTPRLGRQARTSQIGLQTGVRSVSASDSQMVAQAANQVSAVGWVATGGLLGQEDLSASMHDSLGPPDRSNDDVR